MVGALERLSLGGRDSRWRMLIKYGKCGHKIRQRELGGLGPHRSFLEETSLGLKEG